jgi:hypothetical protein
MIPKIIHQTIQDKKIVHDEFLLNIDFLKSKNLNYRYSLYDDEDIINFIKKQFYSTYIYYMYIHISIILISIITYLYNNNNNFLSFKIQFQIQSIYMIIICYIKLRYQNYFYDYYYILYE